MAIYEDGYTDARSILQHHVRCKPNAYQRASKGIAWAWVWSAAVKLSGAAAVGAPMQEELDPGLSRESNG
jgi:hypothetical protein